ncbi:MAG: hypothetical protein A2506_08635, partial [Elusimicrobia bacterium RIFOXYD12_FULL_66_9]
MNEHGARDSAQIGAVVKIKTSALFAAAISVCISTTPHADGEAPTLASEAGSDLREGQPDTVRAMIEKGLSPDDRAGLAWTPLMWASFRGYRESVELLLDKKCDVGLVDEVRRTALMIAAEAGHTEIVGLLIERGAIIDTQDAFGWTALMRSAWAGRDSVVRLLLDRGADPNLASRESYSEYSAFWQRRRPGI